MEFHGSDIRYQLFREPVSYTHLRYEGNGVKRALSMARFTGKLWLKAKWIARKFRPDAIITSSTYPIDTYACLLYTSRCV